MICLVWVLRCQNKNTKFAWDLELPRTSITILRFRKPCSLFFDAHIFQTNRAFLHKSTSHVNICYHQVVCFSPISNCHDHSHFHILWIPTYLNISKHIQTCQTYQKHIKVSFYLHILGLKFSRRSSLNATQFTQADVEMLSAWSWIPSEGFCHACTVRPCRCPGRQTASTWRTVLVCLDMFRHNVLCCSINNSVRIG